MSQAIRNPSGRAVTLRRCSLGLLVLLFTSAGIMHFLRTDWFTQIVPPGFPHPRLLVYLSGICELLGALGLSLHYFRRLAAWGLLALLVAVLPANLYMAIAHERWPFIPLWMLYLRLPMQFLLMYWVYAVALRVPKASTIE